MADLKEKHKLWVQASNPELTEHEVNVRAAALPHHFHPDDLYVINNNGKPVLTFMGSQEPWR